jgi:hypothetical protein
MRAAFPFPSEKTSAKTHKVGRWFPREPEVKTAMSVAKTYQFRLDPTTEPDLVAQFDYVRFKRPIVPKNANLATMSDQEILRFLGDAAM